MGRMVVVCDPETALGFGLAGVEVRVCEDARDAAGVVAAMLEEADVALVALREDWHEALPDALRRRVDQGGPTPVVAALPSLARAAVPGEDTYIIRMIRRVIGYQLQIRR